MSLGAPELIIILIPALIALGLPIWGIVDAASLPDAAWARAGQNKTLWIVLQAIGLIACLGFVLAIVYFAAIRPKVRAAALGEA